MAELILEMSHTLCEEKGYFDGYGEVYNNRTRVVALAVRLALDLEGTLQGNGQRRKRNSIR